MFGCLQMAQTWRIMRNFLLSVGSASRQFLYVLYKVPEICLYSIHSECIQLNEHQSLQMPSFSLSFKCLNCLYLQCCFLNELGGNLVVVLSINDLIFTECQTGLFINWYKYRTEGSQCYDRTTNAQLTKKKLTNSSH